MVSEGSGGRPHPAGKRAGRCVIWPPAPPSAPPVSPSAPPVSPAKSSPSPSTAAEQFEINDPSRGEWRQATLDHCLPRHGRAFAAWLDEADAVGARIEAEKMFAFASNA